MPQNSVSATPDVGVPGDPSDFSTAAYSPAEAATNEEASAEIPFGYMVKAGSIEGTAKLLASTADVPMGISVRSHDFTIDEEIGPSGGVLPDCTLGVARSGRWQVRVEDSVTRSSGVYVRTVAGQGSAVLVVPDFTFTADSSDVCTALAHGLSTGDGPFQLTTTAADLPSGLSTSTNYWIIALGANTFSLATTRALAQAGTAVNIADAGTGVHTVADTASTERVVTGLAGAFRGTPDGSPLVNADDTFVAFIPLVYPDATFTAAASDVVTITAHGLSTGDGPFRLTTSAADLPLNLLTGTDYWVIVLDANTFKLATTLALARVGTPVDIADAGSGTHTFVDVASTSTFANGIMTAVAHGLLTGDGPFQVSTSSALPTGLLVSTNYWVIKSTADRFKLATSRANALAGTAIDLTAAGAGTQTIADTADTERVTTINISKFASWQCSASLGGVASVDIDMVNAALVTV